MALIGKYSESEFGNATSTDVCALPPFFDARACKDQGMSPVPDPNAIGKALHGPRGMLRGYRIWTRLQLEAGALMSYGADPDAIFQHTAVYVA
jgi:hypothetical protein